MAIPAKKLVQLLIEHDPASPEFRSGVREALGPQLPVGRIPDDSFDLWHDVFVQQKLPWRRFFQSTILHGAALALIWAVSLAWLRQQRILTTTPFDRSSLVTYSPQEYLPPLDTGAPDAPRPETGDPAFARQPILSVPREADNRSQTIVVPPDLKLDHDVPLPNIVATGTVAPVVPLDATGSLSRRVTAPDMQVVQAAPEVEFSRQRVTQAALRSDMIPPPPDVKSDRARGVGGPETAVVEPPPEFTSSAKGRAGQINIGASEVVAPAPQLPLAEQHTLSARGRSAGQGLSGGVQPVAPPPSVSASGGGSAQGRLIALGIHPVAPTGPVAVPAGNRRGTFAAGPNGKAGAAGTPDFGGSKSGGNGSNGTASGGSGLKGRNNGSLPAGLKVGAAPGATAAIARDGSAAGGDGAGGAREVSSLNSSGVKPGATSGRRTATGVSDEKITDLDRQVFGERRPFGTILNMPNLNSTTGSWVMHFAELQQGQKSGELMQPLPTETSDPGYPLELIRANVHGAVTLYAVIDSDGRVGDIRVLSSPDDRLDSWATSALSRWKFLPALKDGKPVALEAVVVIPFRVRKAF